MRSQGVATGTTVRMERTFQATRAEVFRAWTDVDLLARWFAPPGGTATSVEWDAREGGSFRVEMRTLAGAVLRVSGTFLEVASPERLVFTFTWNGLMFDAGETVVTVELREQGATTDLVLIHERQPSRLAHAFHAVGWRGNLRGFARLLSRP